VATSLHRWPTAWGDRVPPDARPRLGLRRVTTEPVAEPCKLP
jgi:hypothetical protein